MDPVFGYPRIVRFSWSTTATQLEKGHAVKWHFEREEVSDILKNDDCFMMNFVLLSRKKRNSMHNRSLPFLENKKRRKESNGLLFLKNATCSM